MTLNRASRKEADARLGALRKQVSLQVFTLRFEDAACRETRTAAEELAETTSRLSVEINESSESGDLLRKYRVDAAPALVVSAKDSPDLRVYGTPTGYALTALLDALVSVSAPFDPKSELLSTISLTVEDKPRPSVHLNLITSRRDHACVAAAAALWRVAVADHIAGGSLRLIPSLRIIEDFPFWTTSAPSSVPPGGTPFLLIEGKEALVWPFVDSDIISRLL
ncbi:MAG: hypothetical protein WCT14_09665 [Treponemataceae bacterium]